MLAVRKDHFLGLLTFLAVFSLLLERNHSLVLGLPDQRPSLKKRVEEPSPFLEQPVLTAAPTPLPAAPATAASPAPANAEQNTQLQDNIPKLDPAPKSRDAPAFFRGFL